MILFSKVYKPFSKSYAARVDPNPEGLVEASEEHCDGEEKHVGGDEQLQ